MRKGHRRRGARAAVWRRFEPLEPRALLATVVGCDLDSCLTAMGSMDTGEPIVASPGGLQLSGPDGDYLVGRASPPDQGEAAVVTQPPLNGLGSDLAIVTLEAGANDEVHWTVTGPTSVAFDWRGPDDTIQYGLTSAYGQFVAAQAPDPLPFSSSGPFWEASITGLQEDTLYHYSIGGGPDHTFRTPPPRGESGFTVYVEADVGESTSYARMPTVQSQIAAGLPAFVLVGGDLTYGNPHGQAAVDQHFNDVMVWSQDAAYMPAWGNHEWDVESQDDLRNYKGRFDFPNPQISPGSPAVSCCGEDWYWFDYGNARFIAYPEPWSGAWSDWNTKADALMDEAEADPDIDFIVTWGHRTVYSSGHHPGDSTLRTILDNLGANHSKYVLNLNGHSHNYERTFPQNGVVHITAGTGGSSLETDGACLWKECTQPAYSAFRAMHLGPVRLDFTATGIEGAFVCGPAGGGTNDITCNEGEIVDHFTVGSAFTITKTVASIQNPDTSDGGSVVDEVGDVINYSVALDNTSAQPLTVTSVSDPLVALDFDGSSDTNGDGLLDPNEIWLYTGSYTVTQTDIDSNGGGDGVIENTATAFTVEAGMQSDSVNVPLQQTEMVFAESEATVTETLDSGDLTSTFTSDDVYEVITERHSGGKPSNRTSSLVHEWTFRVDVTAVDDPVGFFVEAHHTDNTEGDDFEFAFPVGGGPFLPMMTVEKTTDDDRLQFFSFPANTFAPGSNVVLIRATDTNTDPGNGATDSLLVDWMYMEISGDVQPPLPSVSVTASDSTAVETPLDTGEFTVTRSNNSGVLTVDYSMGGIAIDGTDYSSIGTQVVFADGETSKTITITPIGDALSEGSETVVLTLQGGAGYAVGSPNSGTVTLFDTSVVELFAISEQTVDGSLVGGSLEETKDKMDGTYEELSEVLYAGGNRSRLEHRWTFDVPDGSGLTFHVEARRTDPSEDDDDIAFEYSTDGQSWTQMLTVSEAVDTVHTIDLTGISGTVFVRVMDANRSRINNSVASKIWIDEMFMVYTLF